MKIKPIFAIVAACLVAITFTACKKSGAANGAPTAATTAQFNDYVSTAQQAITNKDIQGLNEALKKISQLPLTPGQQEAVNQLQARQAMMSIGR